MSTALAEITAHARREMAKAIVGQQDAVDLLILTLVCNGHALIEGVPGVAKTLAVRTLARLLGLRFQRIQCTPDLMPGDIVGVSIFNLATSQFVVHDGPVFSDLLLVDEINRMPPRTQAALLEAMEERQVTLDGRTRPLSPHFAAFATQNPVEFEGTYPLPEAELDRFLVKIRFDYPSADDETAILQRYHSGFDARRLDAIVLEPLPADTLEAARRDVAAVHVEPPLFTYVSAVGRRTREWPALSLGASPRAVISLMQAAKAHAAMDGRNYLLPDDVKTVAVPVLRHRLVLKPDAGLDGLTSDQVLHEVLGTVEAPR